MGNWIFDGHECEDYDLHWGFPDFTGKIVADFGADSGGTPSYFLHRGAKQVIAISGRAEYDGLVANIKKFGWEGRVIPINCWVSSSKDFIDIIEKYKPDILKCDLDPETRTCKLCEWYLHDCPDEVLKKVPEIMVEWHDNESPECTTGNHMIKVWQDRFTGLGYDWMMRFWSGLVIYAKRK